MRTSAHIRGWQGVTLALAQSLLFGGGVWAAPSNSVPFVTPPGITIQTLGAGRGKDGVLRVNARKTADAYADAHSMTLYTWDKDTLAGKSACDGTCAENWPAATPVPGAVPTGDWTLIVRGDGKKQWAYKGKPVYTFAKDEVPGDNKGAGAADGAWHTLLVTRPESAGFPFGIDARDVADAGGHVLVNGENKTLYAFSGSLAQEKAVCYAAPCAGDWIAVAAPAVAGAMGDFTIAVRADGSKQWAYKGKPLYTFAGDVLPDDANGMGVDRRWAPAMVARYPMPAGVAITLLPANGKIFTTSSGKSLYRYSFYQRVQSNDGLRAGTNYPAIGQALGAKACSDECLKTWKPLTAAKNAQPSWHWTILVRDDGSRQWAYKGYALYTYADDKKTGDLLGLNTWDIETNDKDLRKVSVLAKIGADNALPSAFYWTTAYP